MIKMEGFGKIKFNNIALKDKPLFDKYLRLERHELSVYAFENIYIWKALFRVRWALIDRSLCVFFKDHFGTFLYLALLSRNKKPQTINKVFDILGRLNKNKDVSRIENIEAKDRSYYEKLGYNGKNKSCDYLYLRNSLVNLTGNKFKSKRASYNYFVKHYEFEYQPFSIKERDACMHLYDQWMQQRKAKSKDPVYLGMLEDSRRCLKLIFNSFSGLNYQGLIVRVKKEIKGFTLGFKLNENTFCILYEITDLSIRGIAQFIFAVFSKELKGYRYINIMDDSGLENLKKVKLSYQPVRLIPAFIVSKKNEYKYR
jgi:hypothetical protein